MVSTLLERGISQSGLSLFRYCPYAYKLKYIDKCERMFFDHSILDVGSYVHDSIDKYYKLHFLMDVQKNDILLETYDILKSIWDTSLLPEQLSQAYTCLENHAEWEYNNLQRGIRVKPLTEQKISYDGYYGILDYIDLPSKKFIDWKTGKRAYLSYDYRMQAYIYKILSEGMFNVKLNSFYFFFLYPKQWRKVSYNDEKQIKVAEETEKLKVDLIDSLERNEFEKCPRTDNGCKNCSLAYYCQIRGM